MRMGKLRQNCQTRSPEDTAVSIKEGKGKKKVSGVGKLGRNEEETAVRRAATARCKKSPGVLGLSRREEGSPGEGVWKGGGGPYPQRGE